MLAIESKSLEVPELGSSDQIRKGIGFPLWHSGLGADVVTTTARVTAMARIKPQPRNVYMPTAWPANKQQTQIRNKLPHHQTGVTAGREQGAKPLIFIRCQIFVTNDDKEANSHFPRGLNCPLPSAELSMVPSFLMEDDGSL